MLRESCIIKWISLWCYCDTGDTFIVHSRVVNILFLFFAKLPFPRKRDVLNYLMTIPIHTDDGETNNTIFQLYFVQYVVCLVCSFCSFLVNANASKIYPILLCMLTIFELFFLSSRTHTHIYHSVAVTRASVGFL